MHRLFVAHTQETAVLPTKQYLSICNTAVKLHIMGFYDFYVARDALTAAQKAWFEVHAMDAAARDEADLMLKFAELQQAIENFKSVRSRLLEEGFFSASEIASMTEC